VVTEKLLFFSLITPSLTRLFVNSLITPSFTTGTDKTTHFWASAQTIISIFHVLSHYLNKRERNFDDIFI